MDTLIIFDSLYGNTEKIAQAISRGIGTERSKVINAKDARLSDLINPHFIIFGSPTHGGRAKADLQKLLDSIPDAALVGKKVAAFDTRFEPRSQALWLRILMGIIGYAAPKILKSVMNKGGEKLADPEGFIVLGKEGGLSEGELQRASDWGAKIA